MLLYRLRFGLTGGARVRHTHRATLKSVRVFITVACLVESKDDRILYDGGKGKGRKRGVRVQKRSVQRVRVFIYIFIHFSLTQTRYVIICKA